MAVADVQATGAIAAPIERTTEQESPRHSLALWIVCVSHALNHMQSGIFSVLYTSMMSTLGFGYSELSMMLAANNVVSSGMQAVYGFITKYVKRAVVLGVGNVIMGIATFFVAGTQNFSQLMGLKIVSAVGSSPQHPVGATILSSYFEGARGRVLGLHHTAGNVGTLIAPLLAATLLLYMDWRMVFILVGVPSILMGLSYFLLRDRVTVNPNASKHRGESGGWASYIACLKNKDLMLVSLLMMVGAAGRGGDINQTYLVPHFVQDLGIAIAAAAALLTVLNAAGLVAPLGWGWISDKFPRKIVLQASLAGSAVTTVWLGEQGALDVLLIVNLIIYGIVVSSRQSITQAMVGDYVSRESQDAAFSIYYTVGFISGPIWTLVMGAIMQEAGFAVATKVIAVSYILGMLILIPIRVKGSNRPTPTGAVAA